MNRFNTITYVLFSFFVMCIQNANPIYIKKIRNDSTQMVTITYYTNDQQDKETIVISVKVPGQTTQEINFNLAENTMPLNKLDEAEHYLEIRIGNQVFLCAAGKYPYKDNDEFVHHGLWLQKKIKLNGSLPGIRRVGGKCYEIPFGGLVRKDAYINPLDTPITLVIDNAGIVI